MTSEIKPEDVKLPPLPEPDGYQIGHGSNVFSAERMQAYARLAVLAERRRCEVAVLAAVHGGDVKHPDNYHPMVNATKELCAAAIRSGK